MEGVAKYLDHGNERLEFAMVWEAMLLAMVLRLG